MAKQNTENQQTHEGCIVALGASAGGLDALENFFKQCPNNTGTAYVVIQHLSPDHKSMMNELLGRKTAMPVQVIEEGMRIQPNQVFLIPPGHLLYLEAGRFRLAPKDPSRLALPIDIFFKSLAQEAERSCIGVILSGTGSDGTRGAQAINTAGGLLLAQDPSQAHFDGMPASVIATGLVDAILPVEELPGRILEHIQNLDAGFLKQASQAPTSEDYDEQEARQEIIKLLLDMSGIDFNDYKPATLNRRLDRRMCVQRMRSFNDYFELLQRDPEEVSLLRREILIPVTSFFRDPQTFDQLNQIAIEALVEQCPLNQELRVWVAGCSTGEEAYTLAMLFFEAFEKSRRWPKLKIFATDVNQMNIEYASAGSYPESTALELTQERLERFFSHQAGRFKVKSELRQCIVFAQHNLLADPPFTRMQLVSCRNTLIYFTPSAQKRALDRLQYALAAKGYLLLGSSESLTEKTPAILTLDAKHKIFQQTNEGPKPAFASGLTGQRPSFSRDTHHPLPKKTLSRSHEANLADAATQQLINHYVPPTLLVNEHNEILHFFGDLDAYFNPRQGQASLELTRVLPEKLVPVATALLFKAAKDLKPLYSDLLSFPLKEEPHAVIRLKVTPIKTPGDEQQLLLSFEKQAEDAALVLTSEELDASTLARIDVMQQELDATRESLQATIEELETSNEELQATNEELMASNEELQSSNEELQSVNEELNTVNAEYQEKVGMLNRLNADLESMAKAVGVATVFVDHQLNLTRFSSDATQVFRLRTTDIGRPIDEIVNQLCYKDFLDDLKLAIDSEITKEHQVMDNQGRVYLVRILPYRIQSTHQRGAVATFVDITVNRERDRLQAIIDGIPDHLAVLSPEGTIVMVNHAWNRFAQTNGDPQLQSCGVGQNYLDVCRSTAAQEKIELQSVYQGIKSVLEGSSHGFTHEYPCHSADEKRWFFMRVAPVKAPELGAVVCHVNITSWYKASSSRK